MRMKCLLDDTQFVLCVLSCRQSRISWHLWRASHIRLNSTRQVRFASGSKARSHALLDNLTLAPTQFSISNYFAAGKTTIFLYLFKIDCAVPSRNSNNIFGILKRKYVIIIIHWFQTLLCLYYIQILNVCIADSKQNIRTPLKLEFIRNQSVTGYY